ncbi:4Fe-4S binding protein [Pseudodesulfovibrio sp. JC047]|uniref:pyridoxamine 5'-phosphate oxidase family protein n=1 Tax=Pseudodesulfovibrio sp. JC047 TaxID=2683199 RepID=UPI0013D41064|nr:4Fe-4S binding protein [Pseudodesulfovibrio sp. JC047]
MTIHEVSKALATIGCVSMTTLDSNSMHSRIISVCGGDEDGIYFLTTTIKPFYRQLKADPRVSLCGIYPSGRKDGKNADGQPYFAPGFSVRISGTVREVAQGEMEQKADRGNAMMQYVLEDQARYPATRLFCIHAGKGEIFDFDFEEEFRDHKLLRTRFSFGGMTHNDAGCWITDACVRCGECLEVCTFKAIAPGEPYRIVGERCDECGSCATVCPADAIEFPLTL